MNRRRGNAAADKVDKVDKPGRDADWDAAAAAPEAATAHDGIRVSLIERLRTKLDQVVDAITPGVLDGATLPQLTSATATLIDKIAALEKARFGLTAADLVAERERLAQVLKRYISDDNLLNAIAKDMDRDGPPGAAGPDVGSPDSDEGPAAGIF